MDTPFVFISRAFKSLQEYIFPKHLFYKIYPLIHHKTAQRLFFTTICIE